MRVIYVDCTNEVRVGFAVGKKIGGAVKRNRLKRRLREIIKQISSDVKSGNYLIIPSKKSVEATFSELKSEVYRAMNLACESHLNDKSNCNTRDTKL